MAIAHIIVHGRVQGVGFRFSAQQVAAEHNISGWVKNNPDGTVEIEAEGEKHNLDRFMEDIQNGPSPYAKVEHMDITTENKEKGYKKFQIKG
ncbi:acylphosphatase [Thalassobacillus devorans]|uniref:Acylphosphatase n=1 Tax=Thalassobacillus devorans TaxID=279813 RepID=A0ABQ1P0C7_9BACI|nr:acylphosphatase [Thalassobacillus devorans]NIK28177.1 acylphosphatase [Thalassobacillus devorans]GGC88288.1 acylphosphatase [Thalassobacillus devorans]